MLTLVHEVIDMNVTEQISCSQVAKVVSGDITGMTLYNKDRPVSHGRRDHTVASSQPRPDATSAHTGPDATAHPSPDATSAHPGPDDSAHTGPCNHCTPRP